MDNFTNWLRKVLANPAWVSGAGFVLLASILITSITFITLTAGGNSYTINPATAGKVARLSFKDTGGSYSANSTASPVLILDNGGAVIGSADITLHYEPALVSSISMSFEQSDCADIQTQTINIVSGTIHFVCNRFNGTKGIQLQSLLTLHITANGLESPVLQFDPASTVTSIANMPVLRSTQAFTMSLESLSIKAPSLVTVSSSAPVDQCFSNDTVSFSWLKAVNVTKFLYSWSANPSVTPSVSTISTTISLPLTADAIFSIQAVADNGTMGPIRSIRVARCS